MPDDKIAVDPQKYLKGIMYGNSPSLLTRVMAYKSVYPELPYEAIRLKIYNEAVGGQIDTFGDPVSEIKSLEKTDLIRTSFNMSPSIIDEELKKQSSNTNFDIEYDKNGKFQYNFNLAGNNPVTSYRTVISAYNEKNPNDKIEISPRKDAVVEGRENVMLSVGGLGGAPTTNLIKKQWNEITLKNMLDELPTEKKERFNNFAKDYYTEQLIKKQKDYEKLPWAGKRAVDFAEGFAQGINMVIPFPSAFNMDDLVTPSEELISELKVGTDLNEIDKTKVEQLEKHSKDINSDAGKIISNTVGSSMAFMLGVQGLGMPILESLATKWKFAANVLTKMRDPALKLGALTGQFGKVSGVAKQLVSPKYWGGWLARIEGSTIMGAYGIPAGITNYIENVPEAQKSSGRFLYEGILAPLAETMSEGLLVEANLGSKLAHKAGEYILGVPINFFTEEFTNALQDVFTGSKTFWGTSGWGEAQTGALGMSLVFGTGGALITSGSYGLNYNDFSKNFSDNMLKLIGNNKYKLAGKVDSFLKDMLVPYEVRESLNKANEKAKLFYLEMALGDTENTVSINKGGQKQEVGFKSLPKQLQDQILTEVDSSLEGQGEINPLTRRALIGRKVADYTLFNEGTKDANGNEQRTLNKNKEQYNKDVGFQKITELVDKIATADEKSLLKLNDFIRQTAALDKLTITPQEIKDITNEIILDPNKEQAGIEGIGLLKKKAKDYYNSLQMEKDEVAQILNKKEGELTDEEYNKVLTKWRNDKTLEETMTVVAGDFFKEEIEIPKRRKLTDAEFETAKEIIAELTGKQDVITLKGKAELLERVADSYDITQSSESTHNQRALDAIKILNNYITYTDKAFEIVKDKENQSKQYREEQLTKRYDNPSGDIIYLEDIAEITETLTKALDLGDNKSSIFKIATEYAKDTKGDEIPFIEKLLALNKVDLSADHKDVASKFLNTYKELYQIKNKVETKSTSVSPNVTVESGTTSNGKTNSSAGSIKGIPANIQAQLKALLPDSLINKYKTKGIAEPGFKDDVITLANNIYNIVKDLSPEQRFNVYMNVRELAVSKSYVFFDPLLATNLYLDPTVLTDTQWKTYKDQVKDILQKAKKAQITFPSERKITDEEALKQINALENSLEKNFTGFLTTLAFAPDDSAEKTLLERATFSPQLIEGGNVALITAIRPKRLLKDLVPAVKATDRFIRLKNVTEAIKKDEFKDIGRILDELFELYNPESFDNMYGALIGYLSNLNKDELTTAISQFYHLVNRSVTSDKSKITLEGIKDSVDVGIFKNIILSSIQQVIQADYESDSPKIKDKIINAQGKLLFNRYSPSPQTELFADPENFDLLVEYSKIYEDKKAVRDFITSEKFISKFGNYANDSERDNILKLMSELGYQFFTINGINLYGRTDLKKFTPQVKNLISQLLQYTALNNNLYIRTLLKIYKANPDLKIKRGSLSSFNFWFKESLEQHFEPIKSFIESDTEELAKQQKVRKQLEDVSEHPLVSSAMARQLKEIAGVKSKVETNIENNTAIIGAGKLESLLFSSGFEISRAKLRGRLGRIKANKIEIDTGVSDSEYPIVLAHEAGHAFLSLAIESEDNKAIKTSLEALGQHVYSILDKMIKGEDISSHFISNENIEAYRTLAEDLKQLLEKKGAFSLDEFVASSVSPTLLKFNKLLNDLKPLDDIKSVEKKNSLFEQIIQMFKDLAAYFTNTNPTALKQVQNLVNGLKLANTFNNKADKVKKKSKDDILIKQNRVAYARTNSIPVTIDFSAGNRITGKLKEVDTSKENPIGELVPRMDKSGLYEYNPYKDVIGDAVHLEQTESLYRIVNPKEADGKPMTILKNPVFKEDGSIVERGEVMYGGSPRVIFEFNEVRDIDNVDEEDFPVASDLLENKKDRIIALRDEMADATESERQAIIDQMNELIGDDIEETPYDTEDDEFYMTPIEGMFEEKTDEEGEEFFTYTQLHDVFRTVSELSGIPVEGKTMFDYMKSFSYEAFHNIFEVKETDTAEARKQKLLLQAMLREKADFKHAYKLSDATILEAKIKDMYNKLNELSRVQMLTVTKNGKDYSINLLTDEYKNDSGITVSNIKNIPVINQFLQQVKDILGLDLEIYQIAQFYSGQDSGYRKSGMKAAELAGAFFKQGMIYLNQFADRKTYPVFKVNSNLKKNELLNEIYNKIKPIFEVYKNAMGVESYDSNTASRQEQAEIITQTVRAILEDLKLGNTVENILAGQTKLADKDFIQLMKRWVLASLTRKMTYDMDTIEQLRSEKDEEGNIKEQMFNGKPLISTDKTNPIYYKMVNGKPKIFIRTVVLKTKGINNPMLKNKEGIARYDGGSICLLGQLDKVYRHVYGSVNKGLIKNFFYDDGIYLKHAIHQFSAKDVWGHLMQLNNIAFITNDECEKNGMAGDKYELTTLEELEAGQGKVVDLPLDNFYRIKESASFKDEIFGLSQVINACGIIENNDLVDPILPKAFKKITTKAAERLNETTEREKAILIKDRVFSVLKNPSTYMENAFKVTFDFLLKKEDTVSPEEIYQLMKTYRAFSPVKDVLKHIMNKPLKESLKVVGTGTKVTLTMDTGNMATTRINAIRNAIEQRFGADKVDEKIKDYLDENGFLRENYGIIDALTARRMGIKPFDKVIIYITPTDSAMGVKAIEIVGVVSTNDMPLSAISVNSEFIQGVGKDFDIDDFSMLTKDNVTSMAEWEAITEALMKINQTYRQRMKEVITNQLGNPLLYTQNVEVDQEKPSGLNPFKSSDQLLFMQSFLGENKAVRPQSAKYNILERDAINVGDMFYKNIGEVVTLRELHQLLTQIEFNTSFTIKGRQYDIDFTDKKHWDKVHYMLLIATNDMVDYPKNNNKDYYNSDVRNLFAKMLNENLAYYSESQLAEITDEEALKEAKMMNEAIDALYNTHFGGNSNITKLFSIPRFKAKDKGINEYEKAKSVSAMKKIKEIQPILKSGKIFPTSGSTNATNKYYKNAKFDKTKLKDHPLVALVNRVDLAKLNESINEFYYHKDRTDERLYNSKLENEVLTQMLSLFDIDPKYIPQMFEAAKAGKSTFLPTDDQLKLNEADAAATGIHIHQYLYDKIRAQKLILERKIKAATPEHKELEQEPVYDSDILLDAVREFFGLMQGDPGIMGSANYNKSNPKLLALREDIYSWFKTGRDTGRNTQRTVNYPKIIGMLALKALDRLNPISKTSSFEEAMRSTNSLELDDLILKRQERDIEIIHKPSGKATKNGKIAFGSEFEKAFLNLSESEASRLNEFLNLQEKNISTNLKIKLAVEFIQKQGFSDFDLRRVYASFLGIPTVTDFFEWGKQITVKTSSSNSTLFQIAGSTAPGFLKQYRKFLKEALKQRGEDFFQFEGNKAAHKRLDEIEDDETYDYFPANVDPEEYEGLIPEETNTVDNTALVNKLLLSKSYSFNDFANPDINEIKKYAYSNPTEAKKILQDKLNELAILQAMKRGKKTETELKKMSEQDLKNFISIYADSNSYTSMSNDISKLKGAYPMISYALAIRKTKESLAKEEWTTWDRLIRGDSQSNITTFGLQAPQNYTTSSALPRSLALNFTYNPEDKDLRDVSPQDYYLSTQEIFDRLQVGFKDVNVKGIETFSLPSIMEVKQQILENELTYMQNIFSTRIKNNIQSLTANAKDAEEKGKREAQLFQQLDALNKRSDISIARRNNQPVILQTIGDKKARSYTFANFAKSIYPDDTSMEYRTLLAAIHMKEILSYHIPKFVGSVLKFMTYAKDTAVKEGQDRSQEQIYGRMIGKYSRIYNYMLYGFNTKADIEAGRAVQRTFVPKTYHFDEFKYGFIQLNLPAARKKNPELSDEELIKTLDEKATRLFGARDSFNPLFLSPKLYAIEGDNKNVSTVMYGFLDDLIRNVKDDLTVVNWFSFRDEAIKTGLPKYDIDKVKEWFKNQSGHNALNKVHISKNEIKKGDFIYFRNKERKEVDTFGVMIPMDLFVPYGGKVISKDDRQVTIEVGNERKTFFLKDIYVADDYGNYLTDKVEVIGGKNIEDETDIKAESKLWDKLQNAMNIWVLLTRSYLNALPSRTRNLLGGKISMIEEYIPLILPGNRRDIQDKLSKILSDKGQNMLDVNSAYYKSLASVSNFGTRAILDMFKGGSLTELKATEMPLTQQSIIDEYQMLRQLTQDAKIFDQFREKKKLLYEQIIKLAPDSQEYKNLRTKIDMLGYQMNLSERQLQDRLNLIKDTPDMDDLYKSYKAMVESGNLAFKFNITSDIATKLMKQYVKDVLVTKRMEYVNRDEGALRTASFEIAFVNEFERTGNFDRSLIYAQNAVKRQHAFYTALTRVFSHGTKKGRVLNTLRHYTYNKLIAIKNLLKDSKDVKNLYGWKVLFKSIFSRDIRINGDEVVIFGKKGDIAQYSPANRLANMVLFNTFLYNLSGIIPGLQFIGNPVIMAVLQLTDVIASSFDPDDEDKPGKTDIFYALVQMLQLRGGVGKNFAYTAVIQTLMHNEEDTIWDMAKGYIPATARQGIKMYNLIDSIDSSTDWLRWINNAGGIAFGLKYINMDTDVPVNNIGGIIERTVVPFSATLDRLGTSPLHREITRKLKRKTDIDFDEILQNSLSDLEKIKRARKERFNLFNPFSRFGEYK